MKKLILPLGLSLLLLPVVAFAQANETNWQNWLSNLVTNTPLLNNADLIGIVFKAIQFVLAFLGVVAVVVIIIGGFMWMTAGGNEEKVGKAKKTLIQGLIGLIIVLLAYAIASFVVRLIHGWA
jgi:L-asparagine transporter-like permease